MVKHQCQRITTSSEKARRKSAYGLRSARLATVAMRASFRPLPRRTPPLPWCPPASGSTIEGWDPHFRSDPRSVTALVGDDCGPWPRPSRLLTISNVMSNRILPAWAYVPWNLSMAFVLLGIAYRGGAGPVAVGLGHPALAPAGRRRAAAVRRDGAAVRARDGAAGDPDRVHRHPDRERRRRADAVGGAGADPARHRGAGGGRVPRRAARADGRVPGHPLALGAGARRVDPVRPLAHPAVDRHRQRQRRGRRRAGPQRVAHHDAWPCCR